VSNSFENFFGAAFEIFAKKQSFFLLCEKRGILLY